MNGYGYTTESDELYEDYESDEAFESDESDESDELAERRRRARRTPRVSPGKLPRPGGLVSPPAATGKVVTRAEFAAAMTKVDKKIDANTEAIKKVTGQTNRITSDLASATSRLDRQVGEVKKEVKKQGETTLLLTLLSKPPAIKTETVDLAEGKKVVSNVVQEKASNLLPLLLLTTQGGLGTGDSSNMLILALALSGSI